MSMLDGLANLLSQINQFNTNVRVKLEFIYTQAKNHILDVKNPHRVDKHDLGLSKVQNYAPASKPQAEAGKNNNTVMTPRRVDQYMDAKIYTPMAQLFDDAINQLDE